VLVPGIGAVLVSPSSQYLRRRAFLAYDVAEVICRPNSGKQRSKGMRLEGKVAVVAGGTSGSGLGVIWYENLLG